MKAIVTGACGFLGAHLVDRLLGLGHHVVGVDNLSTGSAGNVAHLEDNPMFRLIVQDVAEVLGYEGSADGVFHLASPASPVDYLALPVQTLEVGAFGTHNALGFAKSEGARFLLASTSEVYGDPLIHPQREDYWGNVNPVGPRSVYDEAKRFSEALTAAYRRTHSVDVRIARIFNTYGPRMRPDDGRVVSTFIVQALTGDPLTVFGDGSQTRSFCYVDDLIDGLLALFERGSDQPTNLGNPVEFTVSELASMILELTGSKSRVVHRPLPADDPKQRRPDIARATSDLGWQPKVPLEEGLERTIQHLRKQMA